MPAAILVVAGLFFLSLSAQAQTCTKVVSFALADATGVHPFMGTGNWIGKWVEKNAKKYPDICFSQNPMQGQANYLVVLSQSAGYFTGFDPVVRTNTSTSTSPVSGSGTVTSNYGAMWNYSYNGTETTTTTTTTNENVPYTVTSNTIYAYAYRSDGAIISRRYHVYSTRSGGDAYNTAGYNLGNVLAAISARGRLIGSVVKDVGTQPAYVSTIQQPIQSAASASPQDSAQPPLAALPRPAAAPACKLYSETGEKESISENADGKILIFSDGSMWEVTEIDATTSSLWLPVDDVIVMRSDDPTGCFVYTIVDASEHAEKVQAQYLGQR
jgi:hypothetical protein